MPEAMVPFASGPAENTPPPAPVSAAPQKYGRYILIDRLGAGGMAEVFRALVLGPENFQRMAVVKRILPHLSANENFIKMFIDEATICGRLSHPNVIQVHEFGKQDDTYFIAMEYVQGRPLGAIMARLGKQGEHMPATVAAEVARQACLGLGYAHSLLAVDGKPLRIVHRDVSPGNLMVTWTGAVKVLDFGIARVANEFRVGETDAGQVKGKSAYLSPEQIAADGIVDERSDIFAVGILLHEMLCGRRLFKAPNAVETMKMIREMTIPKPSSLNPDVPARLESIVLRALSRKASDRYQHCSEMADALEGFLIEQRFSGQDVGRFMRRVFKDEAAQDHAQLTNAELSVIKDTAVPFETGELPGSGGSRKNGTPAPAEAESGGAAKGGVGKSGGKKQKNKKSQKDTRSVSNKKSEPGAAANASPETARDGDQSDEDEASDGASLLSEWPDMDSTIHESMAMEDDARAARKKRMIIVGGVAGVGLVALLVLLLSRGKAPAPEAAAPPPVIEPAPPAPVPVPAAAPPAAAAVPAAPAPAAAVPAAADPVPAVAAPPPVPAAPPAPVPTPPPAAAAPVAEKPPAPPAEKPAPVAEKPVVAAPKPVAEKPVVAAPKPVAEKPVVAAPKPVAEKPVAAPKPVAEKPVAAPKPVVEKPVAAPKPAAAAPVEKEPAADKAPKPARKKPTEKVRNAIPIDPFAN